jgi:eukaryotic-like serine/threonine-protein kinase
LLAHVLGGPVDEEQADRWAAKSQAEDPPGPPEPAELPRRLGEFELLSELGRGGMGVVYRAWQPSLGRQVAIKSLIRAGDPKAEARFNREIHALGRVEHPNLVKVFTSGAEADRWFYAMEPTPELMLKVQSSDPESPRRMNPRVPEELEAVVVKCLEKDRGRRYGTARELADDLGRWLRGESVHAQPPTLGYLLGKSLRRHRVALTLASAVLLALMLGGIAVSLRIQKDRLERLRREAERARSIALTERDRANAELERADEARQGEASARTGEVEARRTAEVLKEGLRLRLVQKVDISDAVKLTDQGDLFGSHPWFANAHRPELGDIQSGHLLRVRLNAVLQHGPRLNQVLPHDGPVLHAEFSPDSRRVVTASFDRTARVWDAATGQAVAPPLGHRGDVNHAAFSPDGRRVVTAS